MPGEAAHWPASLSLAVELNEVVLIEGAGPAAVAPLLEVAATLQAPGAGRVRHWGQDAASVPREELYQIRRRIAYISPRQVLLHRLSLGENIALSPCYYQGYSESEALAIHADLLELMGLPAHFDQYPSQVSAPVYARAVWARELVKLPDLILVAVSGEASAQDDLLAAALRDYLNRHRAGALLAGKSLEPFYPLGHRLLRLEAGDLRKQPLLEHRAHPLTAYLPLV